MGPDGRPISPSRIMRLIWLRENLGNRWVRYTSTRCPSPMVRTTIERMVSLGGLMLIGSSCNRRETRYAVLMARAAIRPALVLALSWLLVSVVMTALLAPQLGIRGLAWLAIQDALCLFGCGWEIRRAWRVQQGIRDKSAAP